MDVRWATSEDLETLVRLRIHFLGEIRPLKTDDAEQLKPQLRAWFSQVLAQNALVAALGMEDGKIAATVMLTLLPMPPSDYNPSGRVGHLFNVYTVPGHRGRGHAVALLRALLAHCAGLGVQVFNLDATRMGKPIYEKLGFEMPANTHMTLRMPCTPEEDAP